MYGYADAAGLAADRRGSPESHAGIVSRRYLRRSYQRTEQLHEALAG